MVLESNDPLTMALITCDYDIFVDLRAKSVIPHNVVSIDLQISYMMDDLECLGLPVHPKFWTKHYSEMLYTSNGLDDFKSMLCEVEILRRSNAR